MYIPVAILAREIEIEIEKEKSDWSTDQKFRFNKKVKLEGKKLGIPSTIVEFFIRKSFENIW